MSIEDEREIGHVIVGQVNDNKQLQWGASCYGRQMKLRVD